MAAEVKGTYLTPWPSLLLVAEAAELLRVDASTVYRWCRRGVLPSLRVGGSVRINADNLRDYMEGAA